MMYYTQTDLKNKVQNLHAQAETLEFSINLLSGKISSDIYKNYCYQMYLITDAIESKYPLPTDLQRRHQFVKDMSDILIGRTIALPATVEYISYLKSQYKPSTHGQFKGHIYTHYMGWLYGGQIIAKKLKLPCNHLVFNDVKSNIAYIRNEVLLNLTDFDLDEACRAFEATIKIYKQLYELH